MSVTFLLVLELLRSGAFPLEFAECRMGHHANVEETTMKSHLWLTVLAGVGLSGCGADTWEGWVYQNRADHSVSQDIGVFDTLDQCRASAKSALEGMKAVDTGGYECKKNCKRDPRYTDKIECEATSD